MTRAQAKVLLSRYGFDTSDPLSDWLDEGQTMFEDAHDWPFLQVVTTIAASLGASTLTFPADFFKIQSVRDTTNKRKVKNVDIEGFERMIEDPAQSGLPSYYTITGTSTIQLWPVLDAAVSFRVVYQKSLTLVSVLATEGTSLDGPSRNHYPVVLAAAYTALMAENEEERAQTALAQFDQAVEQRWQRLSGTDLDEPKQVVDVMGYGAS